MVKKLVRLALASEYSRNPIRRSDISAKVMPPGTGRQFKSILAEANSQLAAVFGMGLTELPSKEKITVTQKRAAQRAGTQSQGAGGGGSSSNMYILTSTLPSHYRTPAILPPAQIPSAGVEGAYYGLTSFILAVIFLSPGQQLSEMRLEKHLKRMNADEYCLGGERKDVVLRKMIKDRYIDRIKERDQGGEETTDYVIGSRGKVEVGERGVAGLVRRVYGKEGAEGEEVERRLVRSLGEGVKIPSRRGVGVGDGGEGEQGEGVGEGEEDFEGAEDTTNGLVDGEAEQAARPKRGRPASGRASTRRSGRRGARGRRGRRTG